MRYLFSMLLWVTVARWCYSEIALIYPPALPVIDRAVQALTIPTHDRWHTAWKRAESEKQVAQEITSEPRRLFPTLEFLSTDQMNRLLDQVATVDTATP